MQNINPLMFDEAQAEQAKQDVEEYENEKYKIVNFNYLKHYLHGQN